MPVTEAGVHSPPESGGVARSAGVVPQAANLKVDGSGTTPRVVTM